MLPTGWVLRGADVVETLPGQGEETRLPFPVLIHTRMGHWESWLGPPGLSFLILQ